MNMSEMHPLKYRPDIDGLRAIAVLAVVLYHYGIGGINGGFVGVDIFFVISGFLITGIIHKEITRGDFSFSGFYERRIRRIFPALFAMLLVTLFVAAWLLLPSDLVRLGNSAIATLLFGSNLLFWRKSSYFDISSEYNPLLHTWSLAVEEQFYIGLPILLILLQRYGKGWLKAVLFVCTIVSFALCVWMQALRPSATFFLLPFRAWELLLGGLLAVGVVPPIVSRPLRETFSGLALVALLWSLTWIKAGPAFPGWQAAIPVLATAVLLHAGTYGDSQVKRLLSLRPLVFVGLISYSLYLWHWPLLVFVRYRNGMAPLEPDLSWLLLAVALLLAIASYRWVETPFRRSKNPIEQSPTLRVFAGAGIAMAVLMVVSLVVRVDNGWQARFTPEVIALDSARSPEIPYVDCQQKVPPNADTSCVLGDLASSRRILLWGDSYALAWAPAFDALGKRHGIAVELALLSSCPSLVGVKVAGSPICRTFNEEVVRYLSTDYASEIDAVVLIGSWGAYLDPASGIQLDGTDEALPKARSFAEGLRRTIHVVTARDVRLVIIGPTPGAPSDLPYRLAASQAFGIAPPLGKSVRESEAYNDRFWQVVRRLGSNGPVVYVDPLTWFAQHGRYRYLDQSGELLYRDGGHLSLRGAEFVGERFPVYVLSMPDQATGPTAQAGH